MKSPVKPARMEVPSEAAGLRAEIAALTAKIDMLTAENASLAEKIAALTVALEDARRAA